jgi:hypothetical protein
LKLLALGFVLFLDDELVIPREGVETSRAMRYISRGTCDPERGS